MPTAGIYHRLLIVFAVVAGAVFFFFHAPSARATSYCSGGGTYTWIDYACNSYALGATCDSSTSNSYDSCGWNNGSCTHLGNTGWGYKCSVSCIGAGCTCPEQPSKPNGYVSGGCCVASDNCAATTCTGSTCNGGCGTTWGGTLGANCGSESNQHCEGSTYTAPNGCGTCTGTKAPSCADPATVCDGVGINSSNGCGTCASGTKCNTPYAPTIASPAVGASFSNVTYVTLTWNGISSWSGGGSCGSSGNYDVCIDTVNGGCATSASVGGGVTSYQYNQSAAGTYYWKVRANNSCGAVSAYASSNFVIIRPAKTCSIGLPASNGVLTVPVAVTLTGNANATYGDTVRLWVEKADHTQLSPNNIAPAATQYIGGGVNYYYLLDGSVCTSSLVSCTTTTNVTLPTKGNYIFHCDVMSDPGKCSGNPFCTTNGGSGSANCTGYANCGGTLNVRGGDNEAYCSDGGPYYGACDPVTHTRTTTWDCKAPTTEACLGSISGTFFDASNLAACPADPQTLAGNLKISGGSITATGFATYNANTDVNGLYTLANIASPDTVSLSVNPGGGYITTPKFACQGSSVTFTGSPAGCLTQPCETSTNDFGFTKNYGGWYQALGGGVFGSLGITDNIPGTVPANQQHLIVADANGQDGLAYYLSGSINLGTFPGLTVSPSGWNANTGWSGDKQDYYYWTGKMGVFDKTAWDGISTAYAPGSNGYQIYTHTGDVTLNFGPAAGEKRIYLINGNVTVTGNISVPKTPGSPSFLAVIASGTITFNTGVSNVDGWWVGNSLSFPSAGAKSDIQFVGNGSFVGWSSINLSRDQTGTLNNSQPAEKFNFRPDLLINAPGPMLLSNTVFQLEAP